MAKDDKPKICAFTGMSCCAFWLQLGLWPTCGMWKEPCQRTKEVRVEKSISGDTGGPCPLPQMP